MYATIIGPCICCGQIFSYNPHYVPSTRIFTGEREPVCENCMRGINARRVAKDLEPFPIHPEAYEPIAAEEL